MRSALAALFAATLFAQTPGPAVSVDAAAGRRPISPDIYGINDYDDRGLAARVGVTVRRWGGDQSTRYNWKLNTYNAAADWYFGNFVLEDAPGPYPDGKKTNYIFELSRRTGSKVIHTIPMIEWLPKSRARGCSYSIRKYGSQKEVNPYDADCGNGTRSDGSEIKNDPNDVSIKTDLAFQREWVEYLVNRYGSAGEGGVAIYGLDNEPTIWQFVHKDVHPQDVSYDELLDTGTRYAEMIKSVDPTAQVMGPSHSGWMAFFYSAVDWRAGWSKAPWKYWTNPVDRNAHGGLDITSWYLQKMCEYEQRTGRRLLDYLELHAYVVSPEIQFKPAGDETKQRQRLDSVRAFWDPTWSPMQEAPFEAPRMVPRMREWVEANYPGTRTAITEYNLGAHEHINGALAQADVLGVFGREGLDLATLWGPPRPDQPAAFAFQIFRNFDGKGGAFGDTGVRAASEDQGQISIYAAERSDRALTVLLINKENTGLDTVLRLDNFAPAGPAEVWRYSAADLARIVRTADLPVVAGNNPLRLPAASLTLLVLRRADTAALPSIAAITHAASYERAFAPGTMVTLFGSGIGPAQLTYAGASAAGFVDTAVAGTRVLCDGIPAPIIYARRDQTAALIPYEVAGRPRTHVQVEYNGRRSEPFAIDLFDAAPGVFARDASGQGQAAVLNQDSTPNSLSNPESRGRVLQIFATGEGATVIPGVTGLLANRILHKPVLPVRAELGGVMVEPEYAGSAPGAVAGTLQVNLRIPDGVPSGDVPLRLKIAERWSRHGITVSIR